CAGFGSW
nr:immunoglobulin heavy chain junction region [Mus musculus]MBK4187767.1 immunoglobulin heavy chain junction region [Mus musculus]